MSERMEARTETGASPKLPDSPEKPADLELEPTRVLVTVKGSKEMERQTTQ